MTFGSKLEKLRRSANMSQETLAKNVGVSRQTIYLWESGNASPSDVNFEKICEIFGVNAECFNNETAFGDSSDIVENASSTDDFIKEAILKERETKSKSKFVTFLVLSIVGFVVLSVLAFATYAIGKISMPANTGYITVSTNPIDVSVFYIMLVLSILWLIVECIFVFFTIRAKKRQKDNAAQKNY